MRARQLTGEAKRSEAKSLTARGSRKKRSTAF
jgi:hypothetical protein